MQRLVFGTENVCRAASAIVKLFCGDKFRNIDELYLYTIKY